jgi:hypothetical protein
MDAEVCGRFESPDDLAIRTDNQRSIRGAWMRQAERAVRMPPTRNLIWVMPA